MQVIFFPPFIFQSLQKPVFLKWPDRSSYRTHCRLWAFVKGRGLGCSTHRHRSAADKHTQQKGWWVGGGSFRLAELRQNHAMWHHHRRWSETTFEILIQFCSHERLSVSLSRHCVARSTTTAASRPLSTLLGWRVTLTCVFTNNRPIPRWMFKYSKIFFKSPPEF